MQRRTQFRRRRPKPKGRKLTKRQKNEVKTIISRKAELKYIAANFVSQSISTTPLLEFSSFDIPQGVADTERVGDRIQWAGTMEMNLQVVAGQSVLLSNDLYNNVRVILFQWHPVTSTVPLSPVAGNILLTGPSGSPDIYSLYNHDQRQNYKILYDRTFKVTINNGPAGGPVWDNDTSTTGIVKVRIPLKNARKDVQYQGGGLQATNRLVGLFVSDSSAANHPTLEYQSKVFFRDM